MRPVTVHSARAAVVSIIMAPVCLVAVISPRPSAMVYALLVRPAKAGKVGRSDPVAPDISPRIAFVGIESMLFHSVVVA